MIRYSLPSHLVFVNCKCRFKVKEWGYYALALFLGLPTIQFLIACSMQKQKGKAWSILSLKWCPVVSTKVDGGGGGGSPNRKDAFRACILRFFELGAVHFSLSKCLKLQCLGQKPQEKASSSFFQLETPSPSVYLGRHWRHLHHKLDQAFPLHFLYTASDQKLDGGKAWERG